MMKELLTQPERDRVMDRIKKQKFSTNRKNVGAWCMQWVALVFSGLFFWQHFARAGEAQPTWHVFFAIAWLLVALLNHVQWERYKEQFILREMIDGDSDRDRDAHF
jgi:hypothetical protein